MKRLKTKLSTTLILVIFTWQFSFSQSTSAIIDGPVKSSRFQVGYLGSYYNNNNKTYYTSGYLVQHSYCIKLNEKSGLGLGIGLNKYEQQTFAPIYFEFIHCLPRNFFYNFQSGYSLGWKMYGEYFPGYSLSGGYYGGVGVGYRIRMNEYFYSYIHAAYKYQNASLKSDLYCRETLNFNSFALSIGIMLEKK
jgi:hypothetical protein